MFVVSFSFFFDTHHISSNDIHCGVTSGFMFSPAPSWSWSYGSWIYNSMCNQCLSPLKVWVRTPLLAGCARYIIQQVGVFFLRVLRFLPRYNWNSVESGVKHQKPNKSYFQLTSTVISDEPTKSIKTENTQRVVDMSCIWLDGQRSSKRSYDMSTNGMQFLVYGKRKIFWKKDATNI